MTDEIVSRTDAETLSESEMIFTCAMDIGERMLCSGAEVNRVEDTVSRICRTYGMTVDIFSITSLIIATVRTPENRVLTQTRRAYSRSTDLCRLEDYNAMSRKICDEGPTAAAVRSMIDELTESRPKSRILRDMIGYILAAGGFAMFFGGTLIDGVAAAVIGLLIYLMDHFVRPPSPNQLIYTFLCSAAAGTAAALTLRLGAPINVDKVIIGDIMVLVPGMAITNSIRDMFCGDIMTGLLRLSESVLSGAAIAAGVAVPVIMFGI